MALWDRVSPDFIKFGLIGVVTLLFHWFFIKRRLDRRRGRGGRRGWGEEEEEDPISRPSRTDHGSGPAAGAGDPAVRPAPVAGGTGALAQDRVGRIGGPDLLRDGLPPPAVLPSPSAGASRPDPSPALGVFRAVVETQFAPAERDRLVSVTVPCMARYALSLSELRPASGFRFSLRGLASSSSLDRRFAASLVANAFFSTFPLRSPSFLLPHLPASSDLSFPVLFGDLHRCLDQALRLRNLLNYFDVLDSEEPWGHLRVERRVPPSPVSTRDDDDCPATLAAAAAAGKPLTPIYVTHERRGVDLQSNTSSLTLGRLPPLDFPEEEKEGEGDMSSCLVSHPELLVTYLFVEQLEAGERLVVTGLLSKTQRKQPGFEAVCVVVGDEDGGDAETRTPQKFLRRLQKSIGEFSPPEDFLRDNKTKIKRFDDDDDDRDRSSTVSSKSSKLARLADNLSMMVKSKSPSVDEGIDEEKEDVTGVEEREKKATRKKKKKRSRFEDRLKEALARGDTPDSEMARAKSGTPKNAAIHARQEQPGPPPSSSSSASGDSTYSFDCGLGAALVDNLDLGCLDPDVEHLLLDLVTSAGVDEPPPPRLPRRRRRCFSDSGADLAPEFFDACSTERQMRRDAAAAAKTKLTRRAFSLDLNQNFQEERSGTARKTPEQPPVDDASAAPDESSYAWVVSTTRVEDPVSFVLTWLAASLSGRVPLLVFQAPEGGLLEEMFGLCGRLEESGWDAGRLLREVLEFLNEDGGGDKLMTFLWERAAENKKQEIKIIPELPE